MSFNKIYTPIGIYRYNYDNIRETLNRNIGNGDHSYDAYGSIIGGLSNPYYNSTEQPWFKTDQYKQLYPDYLSYMKGIYSSTLSSDALVEKSFSLKLGDRAGIQMTTFFIDEGVGVVENYDITGSFNGMINTNPNYTWIDSKLGESNNYYLSHTLMRAAALNNIEAKSTNNITSSLPYDFGLSLSSVDNITSRYLFDQRGKINIMTNFGVMSPVDYSNWGNYKGIVNSTYADYYNTLSPLSQSFYVKSINGIDLMSDIEVNTDINSLTDMPKYYLSRMVGNNGIEAKNINNWYFLYKKLGNETLENGYLFEYGEENENVSPNFVEIYDNNGVQTNRYNITPDSGVDDLVAFTNAQFKGNEAYRTLISRFHTEQNDERYEKSEIETAISKTYGLSMGRNLLRLNHADTHDDEIYNGYSNPYCRVWTYHYQYSKLMNTIRPFLQTDGKNATLIDQTTLNKDYNWGTFRSVNRKMNEDGSYDNDWIPDGGTRLKKYGVTNSINGLVNITPVAETKDSEGIKPEQCMFSIENLAWKDMYIKDDPEHGLSQGEIGPNGGRIMWFPPYNINFNENVNVNWSSTSFIGRGENIYSYVNTERSGVLSFTILADHPSILNYWEHKNENDDKDYGYVDDVESHEQELLRFFAGCSILKAKEPPMVEKYIAPKEEEPQPKPNTEKQEVRTYDKELVFYVFYPNNYSGVDDGVDSKVSAMEYLANGFATQKVREDDTIVDYDTKLVDIAQLNNKNFGGYEVRLNNGCSIVTENNATGKTNYDIGELYYPLIEKSGSTVEVVTDYISKTNKHWFYRVDKRVNTELLKTDNYVDNDSFGLNSNEGYKDLLNIYTDQKEDNLVSFMDMFVAMNDEFKNTLDKYNDSALYDSVNVSLIKEIVDKYKIKSINANGYASSHGYTKSNNVLNKNRAQSVMNWLRSYDAFSDSSIDCSIDVTDIGNVGKIPSVSAFQAKAYRAAKVTITYEVEEVINLQDDATETFSEINSTTKSASYTQDRYLYNDNKNLFYSNSYNRYFDVNGYKVDKATLERKNIDLRQMQEYTNGIGIGVQNVYNQSLINQIPTTNKNGEYVKVQDGSSVRYSDEERFFMLLKDNDPFLHHKITEKIKYFDPAFHSITPEGFNARLTFLHQCTRQGATIGESDNQNNSTATNLAFGRPPVCVLRIGDQYNTKIIIDSLSIDFGDMQWDLNPEGIGVQQMLANVTISFKFIGGSDLAGAISRLQNALSFNYYANTGVYDNRADMIEKQDDGTTRMKCFK